MKIRELQVHLKEEIISTFFFDEYRVFLKAQWLTISTIEFYIKYINRFINYSKLETINDFNNFLKIKVSYNKLFDRKLKNSTLDKFRKWLVKYYNFLIDMEVVENNYAKKLTKVKIPKQLPNALSEDDIKKVKEYILNNYKIDFFRYRTYMLFETLLYTGMRRSEIVNLKRENITSQYIKVVNGKGQKDRIIYINKTFSKKIQDYLQIQKKNLEYVFCTSSGKQLNTHSVNKIFRVIKKNTEIEIHPHLIRHTYGSLCVKRGINIYTLQQQMGHTDLKTTSIYLYLNSTENWEEMQKFKV